MEGFDIREPWEEGYLFMSDFEYSNYATYSTRDKVASDLLASCIEADAAINKMIRG
tara:strand:+ start:708 stop:875 length:168 start_codon:yes stop_codon:yes gene_type:complete